MTAWHCQGGHKEDLQEGRTVGQSWPRVVQRTTQIYFMNRLPEPHSELEWNFCVGFLWGVKYYSHI